MISPSPAPSSIISISSIILPHRIIPYEIFLLLSITTLMLILSYSVSKVGNTLPTVFLFDSLWRGRTNLVLVEIVLACELSAACMTHLDVTMMAHVLVHLNRYHSTTQTSRTKVLRIWITPLTGCLRSRLKVLYLNILMSW